MGARRDGLDSVDVWGVASALDGDDTKSLPTRYAKRATAWLRPAAQYPRAPDE